MSDIEVLNYISKNAAMGVDSIKQLIDIVDDVEFKAMLNSQYNEYKQILDESKNKIETFGGKIKKINPMQKIEVYLMIGAKTLRDNTPGKISEMLMKGSLMGIIQITKLMRKFKDTVGSDVYNLAEKLLHTEQNNMDECKKFLC